MVPFFYFFGRCGVSVRFRRPFDEAIGRRLSAALIGCGGHANVVRSTCPVACVCVFANRMITALLLVGFAALRRGFLRIGDILCTVIGLRAPARHGFAETATDRLDYRRNAVVTKLLNTNVKAPPNGLTWLDRVGLRITLGLIGFPRMALLWRSVHWSCRCGFTLEIESSHGSSTETRFSMAFTWFLPSFTEFYRVLLGFTEFYQVLPSFTKFYWALPSFTEFYRVYWVLPSFTEFYRVYLVLPSFTKFRLVLLCFL